LHDNGYDLLRLYVAGGFMSIGEHEKCGSFGSVSQNKLNNKTVGFPKKLT